MDVVRRSRSSSSPSFTSITNSSSSRRSSCDPGDFSFLDYSQVCCRSLDLLSPDLPPPLVEDSSPVNSHGYTQCSSIAPKSLYHPLEFNQSFQAQLELQQTLMGDPSFGNSSLLTPLDDHSQDQRNPEDFHGQELAYYCQVEPLDEKYLSLMEHPPLYVNYLTDANRRMPPLGSSQALDQPGAPRIISNSCSSPTRKRSADDQNTTNALSKREKIDSSPASSCCTTALNTNLKPRSRQGTANDPQSIAARQRRERISQRLKILQDLVPNGSKVDLVTMLEKAINYVKFMQLQLQASVVD
ncbi:hypothetical protein SELMODRAFT_423809 [Selaginella moellendorffii]|uniref:BHLH domain-containing protein n=1 Tax=Selaginella moellendorffii TaxID=88036 RepID=D8SMX2_SELML|nr:hypothetical protein SELMODRAFT_423809 [Selaginella moellendorffii]